MKIPSLKSGKDVKSVVKSAKKAAAIAAPPASEPKKVGTDGKTIANPEHARIKGKTFMTTTISKSPKKFLVLAVVNIDFMKDTFVWQGKSYQIDASKIFLYGKVPYLIHDKETFEPLDADADEALKALEPHFSQKADNILRGHFVKETVGSLPDDGSTGDDNFKRMLIYIAIGVAIGYFAGISIPLSLFIH